MSTTDDRIAELRSRLLTNEMAEQARHDAEQQKQRQIETTQAEIRQLEARAAEEHFQNQKGAVADLVNQNSAAAQALLEALAPVIAQLDALITQPVEIGQAVERTFNQRQDVVGQAVATLEGRTTPDYQTEVELRAKGNKVPDRMVVRERQSEFPTAVNLNIVLGQWVNSANSDGERFKRIVVAFALSGRLIDPLKETDWQGSTKMANKIMRDHI